MAVEIINTIEELLGVKREKPIVLIDGDFILYSSTAPIRGVEEEELGGGAYSMDRDWEDVIHRANTTIRQILSDIESRDYIGFIGSKSNFRYSIKDDYKANRRGRIKPKYIDELRDYLISKWKFYLVEGCEVDDAIISWSYAHKDCIIASPDKDLLMTTGNHYNCYTHEKISTTSLQAHEFFWKSMIIGDSADGIKGIPNKGKAYAERMWDKYMMKLGYTAPAAILELYIDNLGEEEGIIEFYKNYRCLKISNKYYKDYNVERYEGPFNKINDREKYTSSEE